MHAAICKSHVALRLLLLAGAESITRGRQLVAMARGRRQRTSGDSEAVLVTAHGADLALEGASPSRTTSRTTARAATSMYGLPQFGGLGRGPPSLTTCMSPSSMTLPHNSSGLGTGQPLRPLSSGCTSFQLCRAGIG
eukprot:5106917-Prymnesium_polylepis.2